MDSDDSESDGLDNVCPICERAFSSMAGLRQHWSKKHSAEEINDLIANKTQDYDRQATAAATTPEPPASSNAPPVNEQTRAERENLDRMNDLLVLVQTLRAHTTVLKRIPKAARIQTAIEFSNVIAACFRPNAPFLSWAHFFTFSYIEVSG